MANLKRTRAKKRLVLDVGASAVRLCELSQTKTGYQLTRYMQREFPITPDMSEEDQLAARVEVVKALLKESKVRHKKTVFGVPGQSVFTRTRMLPPVPEFKLTQIVRYEIQQQIPFALDQIAHDFQVLERTEAGGYDVLMAAIKVDVVEKRLELVKQIKRQIDIVDVSPLSAYNWLKSTGEFGEQGECVALVDVGAATTDIVIEREGKFRFTRSLNIGGNDVTSALAREFNMEWPKAEQLKRERGFAPSGDAQKDGKGGEVIGSVLNRLVSEVNRSFAYFRSQPGGGPVSRVILTGGGACLRNIVPFLQRQLGVEVRIAQPLAGLAIAPGAQEANDHPEQAAVALGLALRCRQAVALELNLIPPRILEAARTREQVFYWALSATTLALIMLSIIPVEAQKNKQVNENIDLLKRTMFQYDPDFQAQQNQNPSVWNTKYEAQLSAAKAEVDRYKVDVVTLDNFYRERVPWVRYMGIINDARPRGQMMVFDTMESSLMRSRAEMVRQVARRKASGLGNVQLSAGDMAALSGGSGSLIPKGKEQIWEAVPFDNIAAGVPLDYGQPGVEGLTSTRGGSSSSSSEEKPLPKPDLVNAISIYGYAQNNQVVLEFVENIKKSGEFLGGQGVYFDPATVNPVPVSALYNAGSERAGAQPKPGTGLGDSTASVNDEDEDRREGRRGGLLGGGGSSSSSSGPRSYTEKDLAFYNLEQSIVTFEVHLQFKDEVITEQKVLTAADEAIASGTADSYGAANDEEGMDEETMEREQRRFRGR
ncbi:MAG: hypothetical protein AMXMBFR84_02360 [Candidatus Hydrogenedentota bacterium]